MPTQNKTTFTPDQARDFLTNRIAEQALLDGTPLSDVEKRMLVFSENDPEPDFPALDAFNESDNTDDFEMRVISLARRAYASDCERNSTEDWKVALRVLKRADFYLLGIMERKDFWNDFGELDPPPSALRHFMWVFTWVIFVFWAIFVFYLRGELKERPVLKELPVAGIFVWFVTLIIITLLRLQARD